MLALEALLGSFPNDFFYCRYNILVLLFTFPISIISFVYRYGQAEPIYPVIIIQAVMFIIT